MPKHGNTPQYCSKAIIYRLFRRITPPSTGTASHLRRLGPAVASKA